MMAEEAVDEEDGEENERENQVKPEGYAHVAGGIIVVDHHITDMTNAHAEEKDTIANASGKPEVATLPNAEQAKDGKGQVSDADIKLERATGAKAHIFSRFIGKEDMTEKGPEAGEGHIKQEHVEQQAL